MSRGIFKFADITLSNQRHSPCLGEHNTQILQNLLGISDKNLNDMEINEIIGTLPLSGSDTGGSRRKTSLREKSCFFFHKKHNSKKNMKKMTSNMTPKIKEH